MVSVGPFASLHKPLFLGTLRAFSDRKFTKTHEWLQADGDTYTMGISGFAANALGEVVYCDLPSEGATFDSKDTICTLESVKAVGEVYAPGACGVLEVNEKLSEEPALLNSEPENNGWLLKLKVSGDVTADMMDRTAYDKMCDAEGSE